MKHRFSTHVVLYLLFGCLIAGCGDGGGPVAGTDEVTAYLEANPELKEVDDESAVVADEDAPRMTVAAP